VWTNFFCCNYSYVVHTEYIYIYIYFFINWTLRMSDSLPERVQILCHAHIICITVLKNRIICCQIFCDLLLKFAFEWIFNVMQLILVKIKWHIKWKYLIKKFHDICLSYYFKVGALYWPLPGVVKKNPASFLYCIPIPKDWLSLRQWYQCIFLAFQSQMFQKLHHTSVTIEFVRKSAEFSVMKNHLFIRHVI
jgi:hypothetical protein